jgi:hypothetical protein
MPFIPVLLYNAELLAAQSCHALLHATVKATVL